VNEVKTIYPPPGYVFREEPKEGEVSLVPDMSTGYATLRRILDLAYEQAAVGKGHERHADGRSFDQQPIMLLQELYGEGFAMGQAGKKLQEAKRMEPERALKELLGAIVYVVGAYAHIEKMDAIRKEQK